MGHLLECLSLFSITWTVLLVLDLLTCTDKHHCVVGPVKVTDIFILNLREAVFMEICAWWTSFLPCPPPSLILGPSCSTSPLGCNSSSPWTISFSRAFPTKYMSQRLPQASDKPIHFFVCLFIKLEKNFGSWGDGSCSTKTILWKWVCVCLRGRELYILVICTLFWKESHSKSFRHCGPYGLCYSYLTLSL